jgi:hypothetical protein
VKQFVCAFQSEQRRTQNIHAFTVQYSRRTSSRAKEVPSKSVDLLQTRRNFLTTLTIVSSNGDEVALRETKALSMEHGACPNCSSSSTEHGDITPWFPNTKTNTLVTHVKPATSR